MYTSSISPATVAATGAVCGLIGQLVSTVTAGALLRNSISGKPIEAELDFRRALQLDRRDPATLHFYAIHLYSMGRLRDALEMERRSVANDSASPQPMMWLAMLSTLVGDPEEARRLWQKTDELGAARPLCAAIARLDLGQTEFLPEWYHTHVQEWYPDASERARLSGDLLDTTDLAAGVLDRRDVPLRSNGYARWSLTPTKPS